MKTRIKSTLCILLALALALALVACGGGNGGTGGTGGGAPAASAPAQLNFQHGEPTTIAAAADGFLALRIDGTVLSSRYDCASADWTDIVALAARGTIGIRSDGTVVATHSPWDVSDWNNIVDAAIGVSGLVVGFRSDGTAVTTNPNLDVSDWTDIIAVAVGERHAIGLRSDGTVLASGDNRNGQIDVDDWSDIVAVTAGRWHSVGLRSDGTVVGTGSNQSGQISVGNWNNIVAIMAEDGNTSGLRADGTVVFTGGADPDWTDIVAVAAHMHRPVGLRADGTVVTTGTWWEDFSHWTDIVAISVGISHLIGHRSDGTVLLGARADERGELFDASGWTDISTESARREMSIAQELPPAEVASGPEPTPAVAATSERIDLAPLVGQMFADVRHLFGDEHAAHDWGLVFTSGVTLHGQSGRIEGISVRFRDLFGDGQPVAAPSAFHWNGIDGTSTRADVLALLGETMYESFFSDDGFQWWHMPYTDGNGGMVEVFIYRDESGHGIVIGISDAGFRR